MMFSVGVLKFRVFCHQEDIVKNNEVSDFGMFSRAPEVHNSLCLTLHFHDFVNALVKIVMCKLGGVVSTYHVIVDSHYVKVTFKRSCQPFTLTTSNEKAMGPFLMAQLRVQTFILCILINPKLCHILTFSKTI